MQERELRIGNKALLGDSIVTIEEICKDGIETPEHGFVSVGQLVGIKLTEEWATIYILGQVQGKGASL